jgi:hypothetical protein
MTAEEPTACKKRNVTKGYGGRWRCQTKPNADAKRLTKTRNMHESGFYVMAATLSQLSLKSESEF